MTLSRRSFFEAAAATGLVLATGGIAFAQETVDVAELAKPGPLPEKTLGSPDAPVTVIEYASMTCGHCAHFAATTFPAFKEKYIDTGKVYFILREFPLDPLAAAAFMLARCAPEDQYFNMVELFFAQQKNWAFTNDPVNGMFNLVKQVGFTQQSFEACLTNQQLLDGINAVKDRGADVFKISATPTFFVNGQRVQGAQSLEEFDKILEPLLAGK